MAQTTRKTDVEPLELGVATISGNGLRFTGQPAGALVNAAGRAQEELGHGADRIVDDFIIVAVKPERLRDALKAIRELGGIVVDDAEE